MAGSLRRRAGLAAVMVAAVLGLAACGASAQVWTSTDQTVTAHPGSRHCGDENVLFLNLGDEQYIYDPGSTIERQLLTTEPEKNVNLPADAVDTGLRRSENEMWLAADGDAVYVVSGDAVAGDPAQKWPRAVTPIGCD